MKTRGQMKKAKKAKKKRSMMMRRRKTREKRLHKWMKTLQE